jgi:hypothetical protein
MSSCNTESIQPFMQGVRKEDTEAVTDSRTKAGPPPTWIPGKVKLPWRHTRGGVIVPPFMTLH